MMANEVFLVKNSAWKMLDSSRQFQIENSVKMVFGTQLQPICCPLDFFQTEENARGLVLIPLVLSGEESVPSAVLKSLQSYLPSTRLFGLLFLLLCDDDSFSPHHLMDGVWLNTLDRFYEQSIPAAFVAWHRGHPMVESFQLAAQISSLFREIDTITELFRIARVVTELEEKLQGLEMVGR